MCDCYRLRRNWEQDLQGYLRLVIEKVDVEELQRGSDLTSSFAWKWSFKERRFLIPMSSWDEWPEVG